MFAHKGKEVLPMLLSVAHLIEVVKGYLRGRCVLCSRI
jgi:hypothetical protein